MPSKGAAKRCRRELGVEGAAGSDVFSCRSRAGLGAVSSVASASQVHGEEYGKVLFTVFLPFFIVDLSFFRFLPQAG